MTYEEFTERTSNTVSRKDYHDYIEPVYDTIPTMSKDFCAEMYDELGLIIFKASKDYCNTIREQKDRVILAQNKLLREQEKLKEMV